MDRGLSVGEALAAFNAAQGGAGAIVSMLGKVRPDGDVKALELTHYEPLTLPGIQALADTARNRFSLTGAVVWHRIGVMVPSEAIVLVATAALHRRDAFAAADSGLVVLDNKLIEKPVLRTMHRTLRIAERIAATQ